MVAYNFKERFVDQILSGEKCQTIRPQRLGRSRHAKIGDKLQLYTGLRTPERRKLLDTVCVGSNQVFMATKRGVISHVVFYRSTLDKSCELEAFARADGFQDIGEMSEFWAATHKQDPFFGVLIKWAPPSRATLEHTAEAV